MLLGMFHEMDFAFVDLHGYWIGIGDINKGRGSFHFQGTSLTLKNG